MFTQSSYTIGSRWCNQRVTIPSQRVISDSDSEVEGDLQTCYASKNYKSHFLENTWDFIGKAQSSGCVVLCYYVGIGEGGG